MRFRRRRMEMLRREERSGKWRKRKELKEIKDEMKLHFVVDIN